MTEAEFEQATPVYTYLIAHPLDQDLTFWHSKSSHLKRRF
jgi:hypothetical protein